MSESLVKSTSAPKGLTSPYLYTCMYAVAPRSWLSIFIWDWLLGCLVFSCMRWRLPSYYLLQALLQCCYYCYYCYCYGYSGYCLVQHQPVAANHHGLQPDPDHHQSATRAQNSAQTTRAPKRNMAAWTWAHPPLVASANHHGLPSSRITHLSFPSASLPWISTCRHWPSSVRDRIRAWIT